MNEINKSRRSFFPPTAPTPYPRILTELKRELNLKKESNSRLDIQLERADNGGPERTFLQDDEAEAQLYNERNRALPAPNNLVTYEATIGLTRAKRQSILRGETERRFYNQM